MHDVGEPLGTPLLRDLLELRQLAARESLGRDEVPDDRGVGEDAEPRAARDLGPVLDLEVEAKVRLVRSESPVRLVPGHPGPGRGEVDATALAPDRAVRPLDQLEEELPLRKGHLDVELRQLLEPVGAKVFVPEAPRDLVVALEAGDDEQLLVDLG